MNAVEHSHRGTMHEDRWKHRIRFREAEGLFADLTIRSGRMRKRQQLDIDFLGDLASNWQYIANTPCSTRPPPL